MVIAALLSTNLRSNGTRMAILFTLAAGLLASGCSTGSIAESYRWSSNSLNNIPPAPEPGPWRLSKRTQDLDAPYPKLGDMPPRPVQSEMPEEMQRQVRLLQTDAGRAANPAAAGQERKPAVSGAPPPVKIDPLVIPSRSPAS